MRIAPPLLSRARTFRALFLIALGVSWSLSAGPVRAQEAKSSKAAILAYRIADGFQKREQFDDAVTHWQKFLKEHAKDPLVPDAYSNLGVCQLLGKHYRDAAVTLRALVDKYPKYEGLDAATFNLGMALFNIGLESKKPDDFKAASTQFARVPAKNPKSKYAAQALYYQGECLTNADMPAQAVAFYQKAIASYPEAAIIPDACYALGWTQQKKLQQYKEAARTYRDFLKKFPRDSYVDDVRLELGECLLEEAEFAEAEKVLAQAAGNSAFEFADYALLQQARAVSGQSQHEKAAQLYASLPKKFPKSERQSAALVGAGKNYHLAGKHNEAQQALRGVVGKKDKEAVEAAYWLAQSLIQTKKPAEAVQILDRSLAAHANDPFAPNLAFARIDALYAQPDKKKETARLYADFAKQHADSTLAPRALYLAALTALESGDSASASKYAEEFLGNGKLAKSKLIPELLYLAGESALQKKPADVVKAEGHFRKLVEEHADHARTPQGRLRIGWCLHLGKKYDGSITYLQQALSGLKKPELVAEAQLLIGQNYLAGAQYAQAVAACKRALDAKSNWERGDEVLLVMAEAYRGDKKLDDAAAQLDRLVKQFPRSPQRARALFDLGDLAYQRKKYDEALAPLRKLADEFPKEPLALDGLNLTGRALSAKKDYKQAAAAFGKVIDAGATTKAGKQARQLRGIAYQLLGEYEPALADFQAFLASKPDNPTDALDVRFYLGQCQASLKRYKDAAGSFQQIIKDKPDYEQADRVLYELGFALSEGSPAAPTNAAAADAFRRLAENLPKSEHAAQSFLRLGLFAENAKKFADAEKDFAAGLTLARKDDIREQLQHQLGSARFKQGKYSEAAAAFVAQVKDHPKGKRADDGTYWAAESYFRADKPREAVALYEQLVKKGAKKNAERVLYQAARCHAKLLAWPDCQKRYDELIKKHPKFEMLEDARCGLGIAYRKQNKLDDARKQLALVATDDNVSRAAAQAEYLLGSIAAQEKKYEQAIKHYVKTTARPYREWQTKAHYDAGQCYVALKDNKRAAQEFATLIKNFPDSEEAKNARKVLENLNK